MKKILASPIGTIIKVFTSTVLSLWLIELSQGLSLFSMDRAMIEKLLTAAMVSTLPMIINYLNTEYKGYGKNNGTT